MSKLNKPSRRMSDAELTEGQFKSWDGMPEDITGCVRFPKEDGDSEVLQAGLIRGRLKGTLGGELTEDPERHEKMATLIASSVIEGMMSEFRNPEQIRSFILGPEDERGKHGMPTGTITVDLPDSLFESVDLRGFESYEKAKELQPNNRQMLAIERRNEWSQSLTSLVNKKIESFICEKLNVSVVGVKAGEKIGLNWITFVKGDLSSIQLKLDLKAKKATVEFYPGCGLRNCSKTQDIAEKKFFTSITIEGEPHLK